MAKQLLAILCFLLILYTPFVCYGEHVLITKHGHKYHKPSCTLVKGKRFSSLLLEQAKIRGYEPCPVCYGKKRNEKSKVGYTRRE